MGIFWLKGQRLADAEDLPELDELVPEIADDLQTALEQLSTVSGKHKGQA